jgi:hypothetical protein
MAKITREILLASGVEKIFEEEVESGKRGGEL